MSTADLGLIVNGVVDLAAIGTIGGLIFARRIVFAATPKPQQQAMAEQPPAPEQKIRTAA